MIRFFLFIFVGLALSSCLIEASNEVQCEIVERRRRIDIGFVRLKPGDSRYTISYACVFKEDAVISDPDTKLANDRSENVTEIKNDKLLGFEYLPTDIFGAFPELHTLSIYQSSIKALHKKNFQGLFKLSSLSLSNAQISTIDEDAFDDLENIFILYLQDNKLTSLPPKVFSKLATLDTLYLNGNQITSLDENIFKSNHKLAKIFLNGNKFTTFAPGTFDSQVLLRQIWLHENEISTLNSEWFKNNPEMVDMRLEGNKITEIPLDFTSPMKALRSIYFSKNPLKFLDFAMFEKNTEVRDVYFNGIKFTRVLNIDIVDKLPNLRGVNFEINDDSCIIGRYHEGTLDKLKAEVKENCKTE